MQSIASNAAKAMRPGSLMARLAALERGPFDPADTPSPTVMSRRRQVRAYFWLGLFGGATAGCIALLALVSLFPAYGRPDPNAGATVPAAGEVAAVDLAVPRHARTKVPLDLHLTGAADESVRVWVRDVPERTWLSKGERQDEHTWALRPADLNGLFMTIGEGAPESFQVMIQVATAAGLAQERALARVRLVDAVDTPAPPAAEAVAPPGPRASAIDTPFSTHVRTAPRTSEPAAARPRDVPSGVLAQAAAPQLPAAAAGPRVARPEGLSGLGGPGRDSLRPPSEVRPEGRAVWWKIPAPFPFPDVTRP